MIHMTVTGTPRHAEWAMRRWVALDGAPPIPLRHDPRISIRPFGVDVRWALDEAADGDWRFVAAVVRGYRSDQGSFTGEVPYVARLDAVPEELRDIVEATRPDLPMG